MALLPSTPADTLGRVEEQLRRPLQRHVAEANEKYNELVVSAARLEDELKRKYECELSALHTTIGDGHRSADQLANEQRELEAEKDSILASIEDMKTQMLKQQNEAESYLKAAASHLLAMKDLQDQFDAPRRQYDEAGHRREMSELQGQIDSEKGAHERQRAELDGVAKAVTDQTESKLVEEHQAALAEPNQAHDRFLADAKRREQEMQGELEQLQAKHEAALQRLKAEISAERQGHEARTAELCGHPTPRWRGSARRTRLSSRRSRQDLAYRLYRLYRPYQSRSWRGRSKTSRRKSSASIIETRIFFARGKTRSSSGSRSRSCATSTNSSLQN
jgi:chromosome segregation ATPase